MGYVERAKKEGARILTGGERLIGGVYDKGYYIAPTVIDNVSHDMEIAREEVFGPVLVVFKASSYEDAVRIHNLSPYGLSASLFTKDVNRAFYFSTTLMPGFASINAPTFGSEPHLPFGGVKNSGLGYREAGVGRDRGVFRGKDALRGLQREDPKRAVREKGLRHVRDSVHTWKKSSSA